MCKENIVYSLKSNFKNESCSICSDCLRFRLSEYGLTKNQKIIFETYNKHMILMNILSEDGQKINTLAFRKDEFENEIIHDLDCVINW